MESKYSNYYKILDIARNHFSKKMSTLKCIKELKQERLGLEGWFRIELVYAIKKDGNLEIIKIKNKGVDLEFSNGEYLELKAGVDLNVSYILKGADNQPCLFLGKPIWKTKKICKESIIKEFKNKADVTIKLEKLNDNWYIGLIYKNLNN